IIGRYQGSVGAARRAWAAANAGALVGYIRAYVAAVDWLYDPANRAEAMEILQRRLADVSPGNAARSYDELLHPSRGSLSRKAAIDPEGVRTVLALRREFARPARPLSDPSRYYDPAYYERALRNEGYCRQPHPGPQDRPRRPLLPRSRPHGRLLHPGAGLPGVGYQREGARVPALRRRPSQLRSRAHACRGSGKGSRADAHPADLDGGRRPGQLEAHARLPARQGRARARVD